jgi:thiamine transport system permease protein
VAEGDGSLIIMRITPSAVMAVGVMALAILPALAALGFSASQGAVPNWDYLLQAARFTLFQAALSTVLSAGLAVPVALVLARRNFWGKAWLLRIFAVPQSLPPLVAVLGLLALFGQAGLIPGMPSIYGLSGILLAHVFFNLPFAVRLLLAALDTIPGESWRLAAQLGMGRGEVFRVIERPVIVQALPGIAGLIFMLCVTSFTIVLTLGGGPRAATLEVAIYQALRFDYEPRLALMLALAQLVLCAGLMFFATRFASPMAASGGLGLSTPRPQTRGVGDLPLILAAGLFVVAPMAAVVIAGLEADLPKLLSQARTWQAIATSAVIAVAAASLALALALPLARMAGRGVKAFQLLGQITLLLPPIVLGAGWFLLGHRLPDWTSPLFVILGNALMALPFALTALLAAFTRAAAVDDRLCESLGLSGFARFRLIDWPQLRKAAALAFVLAVMVSFGDLGVIAFFGAEDFITLPYLLYQRLGSYRTDDAAGLALILMVLALLMAGLADRLGEGRA